jgi:hypothetical protein
MLPLGAAMGTGLDRITLGRFDWTGIGHRPKWAQPEFVPKIFTIRVLAPALVLLAVAGGGWLVMSGSRGGVVESETRPPAPAIAPVLAPAEAAAPREVAYDPFTSEAVVPVQPSLLDKLKISSQSWRRGGLGTNALVSFTVRNNNDYAVKDIAIACSFARRDGSHLTDRTRLVPGVIEMKSRKTFAHLHVGFVNVNADKAKCSLVSAART